MQDRPILIMAGGTGGHIYPALAVADCLRDRGVPLLWLGTKAGLEAKLVPEKGYQLLTINISGLRGKGVLRWLIAPLLILKALYQSILLLKQHKPAAVLGMGGFASGPGGLAAWLMRIPLCIHEQNAIAGLTNRILSSFSRVVMEAFPNTFSASKKVKATGNPVRDDIVAIQEPKERNNNRTDSTLRLLIVGGSLGAKALNEVVPETLSRLGSKINYEVMHQTGIRNLDSTKQCYQDKNLDIEPQAYIDDMAEAYAWADLVLCRAGAMTVAEVAAAGIAAILVPFPYAVDDHQTANAEYLSREGGAILIQEAELNAARLAEILESFAENQTSLTDMARISRSLAKPKATEEVADICMEVAYV